VIGADLDLSELSLEYDEILQLDNIENVRTMSLSQLVRFLATSNQFHNVTTIMARILVAKPHSADVERLISTSVTLKTTSRNKLTLDSENQYLYIYHNMPTLTEWNPLEAVNVWLQKRKHRIKETPKAKEQVWYKGIFPEASDAIDPHDHGSEGDLPQAVKTCKF